MSKTRVVTHRGEKYTVSAAHPAAEEYPWLKPDELDRLAADIKSGGQRYKIVRDSKGRIIDGRNRELACLIAGLTPEYRVEDMTDAEAAAFVASCNWQRREMSASQRAMVATAMVAAGSSQGEAAEALGVSRGFLNIAIKVRREAPELVPLVRDGDLDATTAGHLLDVPLADRKRVAQSLNPKAAAKDALKDHAAANKKPDLVNKVTVEASQESPGGSQETQFPDEKGTSEQTGPARPAAAEHPADAFAKDLEVVCRNLDATVSALLDLAPSRFAYAVHIDSAVAQIKAARATVWQGRPVHICPYCAGADPECKACKGTGRVKRTTLKSAPDQGGTPPEAPPAAA